MLRSAVPHLRSLQQDLDPGWCASPQSDACWIVKTPLTQPTTGKFLEELIKNWVRIQAQTSAIDRAIKEAKEAGCCLLWPAALRDAHEKVNTLSMKCDDQELYHMVADFYHDHPALRHLPQAIETPHADVIKEDRLAALASIHEE